MECLFHRNDAFKYTLTNKAYVAVKGRTWTWHLYLLFIKRSTVIVHPAVTSSVFMSVHSDPARVSDMEDAPPCQKSCFPEFRVQWNAPQVSRTTDYVLWWHVIGWTEEDAHHAHILIFPTSTGRQEEAGNRNFCLQLTTFISLTGCVLWRQHGASTNCISVSN